MQSRDPRWVGGWAASVVVVVWQSVVVVVVVVWQSGEPAWVGGQ